MARVVVYVLSLALAWRGASEGMGGESIPAAMPEIPGALVIVGGGNLPDEVRQTFFTLAGGDEARLVVIPTAGAGADDEQSHEQILAPWKKLGARSVTILHTRDRARANLDEFVAPLTEATAVWFSGGLQSRIADAYLGTRVEQELQNLRSRGGVLGGTSAGAAIQSRTMIAGGNPIPRITQGFDLLPGAIIDQHFQARRRQPRLARAVADHPHLFGVGIDESTALVVKGRRMEVLGKANVTFMLAGTNETPEEILLLQSGDSADLVDWQQKAADRQAARNTPDKTSPGVTSLANPAVTYVVPDKPYAILRRGDIEAVIVDNSPVDDEVLPGHRAGYNGLGLLRHRQRHENLFVPAVAGLNFEHILDGTAQEREILFEPRHAPMQLRQVDEHTVELYQAATPFWQVESCLRYQLLDDGAIELTIESIPHRKLEHDYYCLFFASYMHQPESLDIHFRGHDDGGPAESRWIRGVTPAHGVHSTHRRTDDNREFPHDDPFPLTLVYNLSQHRFTEPWYFGVSHGMAFVQIFRPQDQVRLTQSPSGGGRGNPAWDFQFYVQPSRVGQLDRRVMRAVYLPYESPEQVARDTTRHRSALGHQP